MQDHVSTDSSKAASHSAPPKIDSRCDSESCHAYLGTNLVAAAKPLFTAGSANAQQYLSACLLMVMWLYWSQTS